MKQYAERSKSTPQTHYRLDPSTLDKLSWIGVFYKQHGEEVSASIILRRALDLLCIHLGQIVSGGKETQRYLKAIERELSLVSRCIASKGSKFPEVKPWANNNEPLKPLRSYKPMALNEVPIWDYD